MKVGTYLFFEGRCEEALAFYAAALGAERIDLMRYRDAPEPPPPDKVRPGSEDKILHASFRVGETVIMASDGFASGRPEFRGFALPITVATPAEAERIFTALADGGTVTMPFGPTFFSPAFGMLADRFGVGWMVMVAA